MPLTAKGEKILAAMQEEYGNDRGERVFYASKNAGTITGVDASPGVLIGIEGKGAAGRDAALDSVLGRLDGFARRLDEWERKDAQAAIDARVADAAPIDVMRNKLRELERRMGSGDPGSQNRWRAEIAELKEKIRSRQERGDSDDDGPWAVRDGKTHRTVSEHADYGTAVRKAKSMPTEHYVTNAEGEVDWQSWKPGGR